MRAFPNKFNVPFRSGDRKGHCNKLKINDHGEGGGGGGVVEISH